MKMFPSRSSILISHEKKQNETIDAFCSCLTMECSTLSLLICVAISTYICILFYVHCMDFFSCACWEHVLSCSSLDLGAWRYRILTSNGLLDKTQQQRAMG